MKKYLSFLLLFLFIPIAFADITIKTDQNIYNLGNRIKASASVMQSNSFEGLFKLALSCGSYKLQYFLTPVSLEANFRTAVPVPELVVTSSMLGNCTIIGDLVTNDNLVVEEKESNSFGVTNQLAVLPVNSKIASLPGNPIFVAGVVNEAHGNNVLKASATVVLGNNSIDVDAIDGKFNLTISLLKNIKSGEHIIEINVVDAKNNLGSSLIKLEVTAVPSYIKIYLSKTDLIPGSSIEIVSSLYDQADDLVNATLNLELSSPKGDNVFIKKIQSNEKLDYEFSQYAEPGIYALASSYQNLVAQSLINITTVSELKIKYENESVFVENIGNVLFNDELTFILESELKKYPITKKITIEPGKRLAIDLSKEVPLGIYNVLLPLKDSLEPIQEKINETVEGIVESAQESLSSLLPGSSLLASNVTINDNRPVYKKVASGLSLISGALVGADGVLARNPLIAPIILIVIVILLVVRYGRKPIMRLIKGKKEEE